MDNPDNPYSQYLFYLLGQLMKAASQNTLASGPADAERVQETAELQEQRKQKDTERTYFAKDETGCIWRREENVELLDQFCREGYFMAKKHGHFLLGKKGEEHFIAIPGRFLLEEQPAGGVTGFTLWQPLAGGEGLYESLETMDAEAAETVYGYWVARLNPKNLKISEV